MTRVLFSFSVCGLTKKKKKTIKYSSKDSKGIDILIGTNVFPQFFFFYKLIHDQRPPYGSDGFDISLLKLSRGPRIGKLAVGSHLTSCIFSLTVVFMMGLLTMHCGPEQLIHKRNSLKISSFPR